LNVRRNEKQKRKKKETKKRKKKNDRKKERKKGRKRKRKTEKQKYALYHLMQSSSIFTPAQPPRPSDSAASFSRHPLPREISQGNYFR